MRQSFEEAAERSFASRHLPRLRAELDKQLDRDPDRALFGLPPLAKAKPEQVVQEEAPAGLHTAPTAAQ